MKVINTYNHFYNILRLFDVLPNFSFATRERFTIITYEDGIYELTNDLRLTIASKPHRMVAQCPSPPPKSKLCQYWQKSLENRNETPPALHHPTGKPEPTPNTLRMTVGRACNNY